MALSSHSNSAVASGSSLALGTTSGPQQARGRDPYVPQACNVCRSKKTRCDGKKPTCSPCARRTGKCSYDKDAAPLRKNRNEAFFEALKKRNDALKEYSSYLESLLERCRKEHGGIGSDRSYLRRRPVDETEDCDMESLDDVDPTNYGGASTTNLTGLESAAESTNGIQRLLAPIQRLSLEGGSLMTFGSTSVFRFRPVAVNNQSRFPAITENPEATYVLLVEGVHPNCFNPNFDWARHLPSEVNLTRLQHDKALDLLFKFCFSWCLRIVPGLFLRDMCRALNVPRSQPPPKTAHYSPMLHNALVALSLNLLDEAAPRDLRARQCFANEAKKYIDTECAQPNLCTVSALSILGTYHSSQGEQTLGFMYFGMAARISQALGLDVDCSEWVASGLIEECDVLDRYWTFWTIFAQDVNWSLYVGRDFCVRAPTESDFKDMPVPFIDSEFDQMPFHHPPSGIGPQPNHLSKTFAFTCELLVIARRIMNVVNGLSKTEVGGSVIDEMISDIDLQLNSWKDSLPPEIDLTPKTRGTATPHRLMLHLSYWWFFILLHRPYFHRKPRVIHSSDKEIDHVKLCKRAAGNIMELIGVWRKLYTLRYTPSSSIQPLFAAGTIFLLSGIQATSGIRLATKELNHSLDMLTLCRQHLREMAKSWLCASNLDSILHGLIEDRLKPAMDRRKSAGGPTKAHLRHASDGESRIYMSNPPAGRASTKRRSRTRDRHGASSSLSHSEHGGDTVQLSPTISIHPVMDVDSRRDAGDFSSSNVHSPSSLSANQQLLSPWGSAQSGSPTSQPVPINGRGFHSNASGSSSSGSPVSIKTASPLQPTLSLASLSPSSPSSPGFLRETSPGAGSFQPNSPLQRGASGALGGNGFSNANGTAGNSNDPETLFGMLTSLGTDTAVPYDYTSVDMARYFAMLGGQNLPDVPFNGPIAFNHQESSPYWGTRGMGAGPLSTGLSAASAANEMVVPELDRFSGSVDFQQQQQQQQRQHLTGDAPLSAGGLDGFFASFDAAGSGSAASMAGAAGYQQRRSTSGNFRPSPMGGSRGLDLTFDYDFGPSFR